MEKPKFENQKFVTCNVVGGNGTVMNFAKGKVIEIGPPQAPTYTVEVQDDETGFKAVVKDIGEEFLTAFEE